MKSFCMYKTKIPQNLKMKVIENKLAKIQVLFRNADGKLAEIV